MQNIVKGMWSCQQGQGDIYMYLKAALFHMKVE